MATVALYAGRVAAVNMAAATTVYGVMVGWGAFAAAEASAQVTARSAGTYAKLWTRVTANDRNATTIRFRVNGTDGNQVLAVGASTTGEFEDSSNSDSVSAGDEINLSFAVGGGGTTFTPGVSALTFAATSDTSAKWYSTAPSNFTTANATAFHVVSGQMNTNPTSNEVAYQVSMRTAGTWSNLQANILANARSTTSTLRGRVNGGNGNQSIAISGGTTGIIEDTTNSDTLASGDEVNYSLTNSTGGGAIRLQIGSVLTTTTGSIMVVFGHNAGTSLGPSQTRYFAGSTLASEWTSESDARTQAQQAFTAEKLQAYVLTNSITATSTFTLRKNGAAGNNTVSFGSGVTGFQEDTTNSDAFTPTDEFALELVTGGSGTTFAATMAAFLADFSAGGATEEGDGSASVTVTGSGVSAAVKRALAAASVAVTAAAVGSAIATAAGSAAVTVTATAVGRAKVRAVGSTSVGATAAAASRVEARSDGAVAVIVTVAGVGRATFVADGAATATATGSGVGRSEARAAGSATAGVTADGVYGAADQGDGAASATATATGVGRAETRADGAASAAVTGAGIGRSERRANGAASVSATAAGVGAAHVRASGSASASATGAAVSRVLARAVGSASATVTATGISTGELAGDGAASATATTIGVGRSEARTSGAAAVSTTASAIGRAAAHGTGDAVVTCSAAGVARVEARATGAASVVVVGDGSSVEPLEAEPISIVVAAQDRTVAVPAVSRSVIVPADDRTVAIEDE